MKLLLMLSSLMVFCSYANAKSLNEVRTEIVEYVLESHTNGEVCPKENYNGWNCDPVTEATHVWIYGHGVLTHRTNIKLQRINSRNNTDFKLDRKQLWAEINACKVGDVVEVNCLKSNAGKSVK